MMAGPLYGRNGCYNVQAQGGVRYMRGKLGECIVSGKIGGALAY